MQRLFLPGLVLALAYLFWLSPDFKEIAAGVALFLLGMVSLETSFKGFSGGILETVLRQSTDRLWKSLAFGLVTTTLMQSSTLVSLVTISFVSTQMISLASGIGVIMGANLGTTTGAWLIATLGFGVNIAAYALPLLVFGVIFLFNRNRVVKNLGHLALGIGFLFLGIHYMKIGFEAFQDGIDLTQFAVSGFAGVVLFAGIGTLMTIIMQSSHATLLIIIAALATGQVSYENALALAIGANLGSAFTAVLAGASANLDGKRLAVAHVLFNAITAVVAILFITEMGALVEYLATRLGLPENNLLLRLALFHTLFNLLGVILLLPFVRVLENGLTRLLQFQPKSFEQPRFLLPQALETPGTGVHAIRMEVARLYDNAHDLIALGLSLRRAVIDSDLPLPTAVKNTRRIIPLDLDDAYEKRIKSLHSAIIAFAAELQRRELSEPLASQLYQLQQASQDIVEAVKAIKHMHKNLSRYGVSVQPQVRQHYDAIRLQLAKLLRELRQLRSEKPNMLNRLSLDAMRLAIRSSNQNLIHDINSQVRSRQLAPQIATSIMNDENYAYTLAENMIEASHALLLSDDPSDQSVEQHLSLDRDEITRIATTSNKVPATTGPTGNKSS